jgi:MFS family permease
MNVVVAVHAGEHFGLNPTGRGLVVAAFGVAGLLTGAYTGRTADRFGQRRAGMVFLAVFALAVAATAYSPTVAVLAAFVGLAGAASTGGRVITTSLAMLSTPENRGGATSFMLSWQFLGSALGPIVLLPLYIQDPQQALVTAAAGGVFAMAALVVSAAIAHPYRFTRPTGPAAP